MLMNKDLLIDGKRYISASRASKKYGYTQDHIGALVRTNKILGKMMGRSWYVDPDSLLRYRELGRKKSKLSSKSIGLLRGAPKVNPFGNLDLKSIETLPTQKQPTMPVSRQSLNFTECPPLPKSAVIKSSQKIRRIRPSKAQKVFIFSSLFLLVATFTFLIEKKQVELNQIGTNKIENIANVQKTISASTGSDFFAVIENVFLSYVRMFDSSNKDAVVDPKVVTAGTSDKKGVVVLPGGNHNEAVARVKSAFSDDVSVSIDPSGDSGVVTPNFRSGGDIENYTFVLVPVYPQK